MKRKVKIERGIYAYQGFIILWVDRLRYQGQPREYRERGWNIHRDKGEGLPIYERLGEQVDGVDTLKTAMRVIDERHN